jgi:hypothetical protein
MDLARLMEAPRGWPEAALVEVLEGEVEIRSGTGRQRILASHVGLLVEGCAPAFRERGGRSDPRAVAAQLAAIAPSSTSGTGMSGTVTALRLLELAAAARRDPAPFETFLRESAGDGQAADAGRLARALLDLEPVPDAAR